jgi:hypothetical protein
MKKMTDAELKQALGDYIAPPGLYALTKDLPFLGRVSCNVERIVAGSWQEIVIDYELGASGMADGSWFKATFRFYSDWALFQTTDPAAANYVSAEYHAAPTVPGQSPATVQYLKVRFDQKGHERPFQKAVIVDTFDGYLKAGDHIVIRLGDRRFGGPGTRVQTFVEQNFKIRCYVDPLGTSRFAAVNPDLVIQIVPGVPAQLAWAGSRIVRAGEKLPLRLRAEDQWGNACWDQPEKVEVSASLDGEEVYRKGTTLAAEGWAVLLLEDLPTGQPGELAVTARLPAHPWVKPQTFHVTVDKRLEAPRIYYCDLHVHSEDTIGTNSTVYNLTYGRDVTGLDVLAFAHNDFNITTEKWKKTVELIRQITKDGSFVAYPGTEWCGSSCAGGDHNVVFLHDGEPEFPFLKSGEHVRSVDWNEETKGSQVEPGAWPLEELWAAYARDPDGHLLIPHVGGRRCILDWHYPKLERLIEIGSSWGHFGWLYQEAMERGYKLGASMAGDEHRGRCGGGVPGTAVFGTKGGMSGVIAPELTRKAIAQALRARHTFACTGERTFGIARCGKHIMGDEFEHSGPATVEYRFLGDAGFDEIVACDHTGPFWRRSLQQALGRGARQGPLPLGGVEGPDHHHQRGDQRLLRPRLRAPRGDLLARERHPGRLPQRHLRRRRRHRDRRLAPRDRDHPRRGHDRRLRQGRRPAQGQPVRALPALRVGGERRRAARGHAPPARPAGGGDVPRLRAHERRARPARGHRHPQHRPAQRPARPPPGLFPRPPGGRCQGLDLGAVHHLSLAPPPPAPCAGAGGGSGDYGPSPCARF